MQEVVAVLEMPYWWGCGEKEHGELKGPRESLSGELQTGADKGLDYKRGTALDQVISDSVDVGGKAAGLWLWWWLLRSHRIVGSLTSNSSVLLIERCCWRQGVAVERSTSCQRDGAGSWVFKSTDNSFTQADLLFVLSLGRSVKCYRIKHLLHLCTDCHYS